MLIMRQFLVRERVFLRVHRSALQNHVVCVTCIAHNINLASATMHKLFPLVDKFITEMEKAFQFLVGSTLSTSAT